MSGFLAVAAVELGGEVREAVVPTVVTEGRRPLRAGAEQVVEGGPDDQ